MIIKAKHWKDLTWQEERWPNFTAKEMAQRSEGWALGESPIEINVYSLDKIQMMRLMFGKAIKINSAYRSPEYNNMVADTGYSGVHTRGCAFDISYKNAQDKFELIRLAYAAGFKGIGSYNWGIHVDDDIIKRRPAFF